MTDIYRYDVPCAARGLKDCPGALGYHIADNLVIKSMSKFNGLLSLTLVHIVLLLVVDEI